MKDEERWKTDEEMEGRWRGVRCSKARVCFSDKVYDVRRTIPFKTVIQTKKNKNKKNVNSNDARLYSYCSIDSLHIKIFFSRFKYFKNRRQ